MGQQCAGWSLNVILLWTLLLLLLLLLLLKIYLFLERGKGGRKRGRETPSLKYVIHASHRPPPGGLARNPGIYPD